MTHELVFVIQAYSEQLPDGRLTDVVLLELFAESDTQAIDRAKTIIDRKNYRISQVIEK